jgi:hypothetical protein
MLFPFWDLFVNIHMHDNGVQSRDTSAPVYMQSDGTATSVLNL